MKIKISGPLDKPMKDCSDLVGKPINDSHGNRIGFVTAVDEKKWYGTIRCEINKKPVDGRW